MTRRVLFGILAAALFLPSIATAQVVRIADDRGGRIGTYNDKYEGLRYSGERVMIDGLCASACTIALIKLHPDQLCFTPRAKLGFHAAWDFGENGRQVTNVLATKLLYTGYPKRIRSWIDGQGGLNSRMIFLSGRSLAKMGYHACPPRVDVYANATARF